MLRFIILSVLLAIPLRSTADECELDIGLILPLTGNAAQFGARTKNGAEIALTQSPSFMGRCQLNLHYEDSAWASPKAVSAFRSLVSRKSIDVIVTGASHVSLAIAPLAKENSILQVGIFTSAESFSSPNDLSFRMCPRARDDVAPFVPIFQEKNLKPGALFIANDFGEEMSATFGDLLESKGRAVHVRERFHPGESDFRTTLLKMKSDGVSGLLIVGLPSHYTQIIQQSSQIGYDPYFFSPRTAEDPSVSRLGPLTKKLLYTNPFDDSSALPEASKFVVEYTKRYGTTPDSYSAEGFESVRVFGRVWARCSGDSICIRNELTSGQKIATVFGPIQFDTNGDASFSAVVKHFVAGQPRKFEG